MITHEFKLVDAQAREDFERLLGIKIDGNTVRLKRDVYLKHAEAIQAIQIQAAFRSKK